MDQGGSSYPEGMSTNHEPGRRELPTQSYVRPLSWLDTNLSRQEPEEEDQLLQMKASDRGRNVKSKELFGCFDEIFISIESVFNQ